MIESEIPGILVAMPSLENTYFEKSIILLCNYNAKGAFGLVMNRPSPAKVNELIPSELKNKEVFNTPILLGGPVEPNSFWAIHSSEIEIQDTTKISNKINKPTINPIEIFEVTKILKIIENLIRRL